MPGCPVDFLGIPKKACVGGDAIMDAETDADCPSWTRKVPRGGWAMNASCTDSARSVKSYSGDPIFLVGGGSISDLPTREWGSMGVLEPDNEPHHQHSNFLLAHCLPEVQLPGGCSTGNEVDASV